MIVFTTIRSLLEVSDGGSSTIAAAPVERPENSISNPT
jgi:hypothetical protein